MTSDHEYVAPDLTGIPADEATWSRGPESIGLDEPAMWPSSRRGLGERLRQRPWLTTAVVGTAAAAVGLALARRGSHRR